MITGTTKLAGIIGWPVSHSLSPRLHNFWLEQYKIDGAYVPLPVDPTKLKLALRGLPFLGFRGANLTIPHKEAAVVCVDEVDALARRVGAINTLIVREDGALVGHNTDVFGFSENLRTAGFDVKNQGTIATLLGAGGAARAIIVALQEMGFTEIRLVNRTRQRARQLASEHGRAGKIEIFNWADAAKACDGTALLVNATSLGMVGQPVLDVDLAALPKEAWVTDLVYTPLMTDLLKRAEARSLRVVDGLGMLLHQARPGFAAWFGVKPDVTEELRHAMLAGP